VAEKRNILLDGIANAIQEDIEYRKIHRKKRGTKIKPER